MVLVDDVVSYTSAVENALVIVWDLHPWLTRFSGDTILWRCNQQIISSLKFNLLLRWPIANVVSF
jgi:hypothetical protein